MVEDRVHQVRLFRASIWSPSGGCGTRETGGTAAESLVGRAARKSVPWRALSGEEAPDSAKVEQPDRRRARGVLNPCARESKARIGRFLREKLISDHGLFSSDDGQQGAVYRQDSLGVFKEYTRLWAAGC